MLILGAGVFIKTTGFYIADAAMFYSSDKKIIWLKVCRMSGGSSYYSAKEKSFNLARIYSTTREYQKNRSFFKI